MVDVAQLLVRSMLPVGDGRDAPAGDVADEGSGAGGSATGGSAPE